MLVEDLLLKVSCSFFVKEAILTWTSKGDGIKYELDNVEKTEHLDEIERRSWILDYFFTKTACGIHGFIPLARPTTPCSAFTLRWARSEISSSEAKSSAGVASRRDLPANRFCD
jgi:hypothetical protein